ncbi:MAG: ribosome rescue protein RqcH [Desulfatiglandales bacterium]
MSSFDVLAVVKELQNLKGSRINKVFQINPVELRMQLNIPGKGRSDMVIVAGKRLYLTERPKKAPKVPTTFAMTLRKYLGNSIIDDVEQVAFDRIVILKCNRGANSYILIIELFGNGNVILAGEDYGMMSILKVERFKDRALLPKREYALPPGRPNPFELNADELVEIINKSRTDLVRALAKELGLGGLYAEEICMLSGVSKDKETITQDEGEAIQRTMGELLGSLDTEKPRIIKEDEKPVDVVPIMLKGFQDKKTEEFISFNSALDEYFSVLDEKEAVKDVEEDFGGELGRFEARLRDQEALLEKYTGEEKRYKVFGDLIYSRFKVIDELLAGITKARENHSWEEITGALKKSTGKNMGAQLVNKILPKEGVLVIVVDGEEIRLDMRKNTAANADYFYNRGKKSRAKIRGAKKPIEETKRLIKSIKEEGVKAVEKVGRTKKRVIKKKLWYEKFRWFKSSDGILIIGGRDATSNEVAVKKHMESGDFFVHANIQGAPAVVVKAEGKKVPDTTMQEAFDFAASYSSAWKHSVYGLDVYWVNPDQVSKTTEHGEYVGKGAFVIRGKKNLGKGAVHLVIGVKIGEEVEVIGGPPEAIEKQSDYIVEITPGRKKSSEIAKEIKGNLAQMASEKDKEKISLVPIEEIQAFLPSGGSDIPKK